MQLPPHDPLDTLGLAEGGCAFVRDADLSIYVGDVRDVLPRLPAESVDCVATSPPFFGLRDYGVDQQIGLEETPGAWAQALVGVFRECRRVLRPGGSMFVECGDSYNSGTSAGRGATETASHGRWENDDLKQRVDVVGMKPKDLIGQPFLLAFALRADGWWWRGCYVWAKPNCMPESATDRCTSSHSYVLHFAKSSRYYFDGDSIAEPAAWERWGDQTVPKHEGTDTAAGWIPARTKESLTWSERKAAGEPMRFGLNGHQTVASLAERGQSKHPRSVWTIPTRGYSGAHFATWPEALAERIILAGCPALVCGTCGKARERITGRPCRECGELIPTQAKECGACGFRNTEWRDERTVSEAHRADDFSQPGIRVPRRSDLTPGGTSAGWSDCGHDNYRPGTVLDPFFGSGTTGLVARKHGRRCIGIELNPEYARLAAERCQQLSLLAEAP